MASGIAGDRTREAERLRVNAEARLRPNDWSSVEMTMLDLSTNGFRASCEARVQPGSAVSLDIPGLGSVDAQVEWQRGRNFGARFFVPIDLSLCSWTLHERSHALAELLVERAQAKQAGRDHAEQQLRRRILNALPMQKDDAA
ncbi:hypothetical protein E2493_07180 [Sphingomonas parva]|uniref:PilZ domain-containing protein n=1 Tax=Sphingomonas parva TaxID=2555898 RepID=A0A4Y8ZSY2_9SPHN|nr:PilZ domain-containing protein [Sphingomonas parva]TFI59024.1 hypothetical protein E2493_07180 [Sphingomonas parva]